LCVEEKEEEEEGVEEKVEVEMCSVQKEKKES